MSAMQGPTQEQQVHTAPAEQPLHEIRLGRDDVMVVLSDAHLGDVEGSDADLANFLSRLPCVLHDCLGREVKPCQLHLVLNGDIVDYQLEAEDIALVGGAAFLSTYVEPLVKDGMHVTYLIGNHEMGLHYLLEEMPDEVPVGRSHPWSKSMRKSLAHRVSSEMQPYGPYVTQPADTPQGPPSRFGRGYIEVIFPEGPGKERRHLIFHGDQLNHMVAINQVWWLMQWLCRPVRGLLGSPCHLPRRAFGWLRGKPYLEEALLAERIPSVYEAFELWVASQDEQTIGAANELFGNDPGALTRLASSFCGSRVARQILTSLMEEGGKPGQGWLSRAYHYVCRQWARTGVPRLWAAAWLGLLRWLAGRVGVMLRWLSPIRIWPTRVHLVVAVVLTLAALGYFTWRGIWHGHWIADFARISAPLSRHAVRMDLRAVSHLVLMVVLLTIVLSIPVLIRLWCTCRCNTPEHVRRNLHTVCKNDWLLPLRHPGTPNAPRRSPTWQHYDWCLIGHFHDPRMEQEPGQQPRRRGKAKQQPPGPRMVDVGSWRRASAGRPYNTFATISSEGVQLWQYGRTTPISAAWR